MKTYKTQKVTEANRLKEKAHSILCGLEDVTDYKIKEISKCIELLQGIKIIGDDEE